MKRLNRKDKKLSNIHDNPELLGDRAEGPGDELDE